MSGDHGRLPERDTGPPAMAAYVAAGVAAGLFVLLGFGAFGDLGSGLAGQLLRIGAFALAAGLLLVAAAVYNRNRPDRLPGIAEDSVSYTIARLTRRRDMLRSAWLWLLAPLVPGMALLYLGAGLSPEVGPLYAGFGAVVSAAALVLIALHNRNVARHLDEEIAALEKERSGRR